MVKVSFKKPYLVFGDIVRVGIDGRVEGRVSRRVSGYYRVFGLLGGMMGVLEELVRRCRDRMRGLCIGMPMVSLEGEVFIELGSFKFWLGEGVSGWFVVDRGVAHGEVRVGELVFAEEVRHWRFYEWVLRDLLRRYRLIAGSDELSVRRVGDELYFWDCWGRVALRVWDGGYKATYKTLGWELGDGGEVLGWLRDRLVWRLNSGGWRKVMGDGVVSIEGDDFLVAVRGAGDFRFLVSFGGVVARKEFGVDVVSIGSVGDEFKFKVEGKECDKFCKEVWEYLKWLVF